MFKVNVNVRFEHYTNERKGKRSRKLTDLVLSIVDGPEIFRLTTIHNPVDPFSKRQGIVHAMKKLTDKTKNPEFNAYLWNRLNSVLEGKPASIYKPDPPQLNSGEPNDHRDVLILITAEDREYKVWVTGWYTSYKVWRIYTQTGDVDTSVAIPTERVVGWLELPAMQP